MKEQKIDENGEGHCYPCMGCLDYNEHIEINGHDVKIGEAINAIDYLTSHQGIIQEFENLGEEERIKGLLIEILEIMEMI